MVQAVPDHAAIIEKPGPVGPLLRVIRGTASPKAQGDFRRLLKSWKDMTSSRSSQQG
jgi:hypothetical protein